MFVICFSERGVNVWIAGRGGRVRHGSGGDHRRQTECDGEPWPAPGA